MNNFRHNARTDQNERSIIRALEAIGCDVEQIKGKAGLPDLLVGFRGQNFTLEVKNPDGRNRLSTEQKEWQECWRGQTAVVRTPEEALKVVTNG